MSLESKVVYVVWEDAASLDGYVDQKEVMDYGAYILHTTGHLVQENKQYVAIGQDWSPRDARYRHITWIPKRMILSRQDRTVRISSKPARAAKRAR